MKTQILKPVLAIMFMSFTLVGLANHPAQFESCKVVLKNGNTIEGYCKIKSEITEDALVFKSDRSARKNIHYNLSAIQKVDFKDVQYASEFIPAIDGKKVGKYCLTQTLSDNNLKLQKIYYYTEQQYGKNVSAYKKAISYKISDDYSSVAFSINNAKQPLSGFLIDHNEYRSLVEKLDFRNEEDLVTFVKEL
jgi:hypothetical protein